MAVLQIEVAIGIDGELQPSGRDREHRFDALQIVGKRRAADLHFHDV